MMKSNIFPKILVLAEDQSICRSLSNIHGHFSITAGASQSEAEPPGNGFYEIMIVDLQTLNKAGVELIEKSIANCSHAKLIGIKSPEAREEQQDFGLDFFGCLEKPINPEFLTCTIQCALAIQAKEQIISEMAEDLDLCTDKLVSKRLQFESLSQDLLKNNEALAVLSENIKREREQVEKRVALNLRSIVIPAIDKLKKIKALEPYSSELDLIVSQIEDITSDFIIDARIVSKLTGAELRVASLIKNGLNTSEIARKLNISLDTIRSHRKKIRKKLGISKAAYSLRNFLGSKVNGNDNNHRPSA